MSRPYNVLTPICSMLLFAAAVGISQAAVTLPDGPGKAETVKLCSKCHSMEQTVSLRLPRSGWTETIAKMVNLGADGSNEEFAASLEYLVKNYGATASGGSAATVSSAASPSVGTPDSTAAARVTGSTVAGPPPSISAITVDKDPAKEWRTYGHDPGGMRFSPLKQISPDNVGKLKVAWVYHMRPANYKAPAPPARPASPRGPVGDEPESGRRSESSSFMFGSGFRPSEVTPLVIKGVMYVTTPYSRVAAIDPVTGREIWSFQLPASIPATRGLEFWPGDGTTPAQVVFGSLDGKLYSLDAKTGKPNPAFGDNGVINLNTDSIMRGLPGRNAMTSPPIVYRHLVITGGTTQENPPLGPAGDVRAWDMRTGKLVWTFRSIPQPGEKYHVVS